MTTYAVSGFRFDKEFASEAEARACFEEVKMNFTYCELKKVSRTSTRYYATSIEIFSR